LSGTPSASSAQKYLKNGPINKLHSMQISTSSYLLSLDQNIIIINMFTNTLPEGNQVSHSRRVRDKIMIRLF